MKKKVYQKSLLTGTPATWLKLKDKLNIILSKNTNKDISQIEKDTDRDNFMNPIEALEYGLIDKIL